MRKLYKYLGMIWLVWSVVSAVLFVLILGIAVVIWRLKRRPKNTVKVVDQNNNNEHEIDYHGHGVYDDMERPDTYEEIAESNVRTANVKNTNVRTINEDFYHDDDANAQENYDYGNYYGEMERPDSDEEIAESNVRTTNVRNVMSTHDDNDANAEENVDYGHYC